MNEMVDLLVKSDINTSVITRTSNKNVYANLINKTGGIFADISSYSFSNELKALAIDVKLLDNGGTSIEEDENVDKPFGISEAYESVLLDVGIDANELINDESFVEEEQ